MYIKVEQHLLRTQFERYLKYQYKNPLCLPSKTKTSKGNHPLRIKTCNYPTILLQARAVYLAYPSRYDIHHCYTIEQATQ